MVLARALGAAAALSMVGAVPIAAQRDRGITVAFGMGYGRGNSSCDNCKSGPSVAGATAFVAVSRSLSRPLRAGVTFDTWWHSSGGASEQMVDVVASFHLAPDLSDSYLSPLCLKRCFITAGLGLSNYRASTSPAVTGTGWGFTAGFGYELPAGHRVRLTPLVRYVYGHVGDLGVGGSGTFASGWKQHFFDLGVGLSFRR